MSDATSSGTGPAPGGGNGVTDLMHNNGGAFGRLGRAIQPIVSQNLRGNAVSGAAKAVSGAVAKVSGSLSGAIVQAADWSAPPPQPGQGISAALKRLPAGVSDSTRTIGASVSKAAGAVQQSVGGVVGPTMAVTLAVQREPQQYRPFIRPVPQSGGPGAAEEEIASRGGVAWRVGANAWVHIVDAQGRLVCDYSPVHAMEICAPALPLRILREDAGGVRYIWTRRNGNIHG